MSNTKHLFPLLCLIFIFIAQPAPAQDKNDGLSDRDKTAQEAFELARRWNIEETNDIIYALQNNLPMPYFVETEDWDTAVKRYDLRAIDLSNVDLNKADLSHANLKWASFDRTDLEEANLSDTDLSGAVLSLTNLWKADITESILTDAVLADAILDEADLRSSDMRGTLFTGARLKGANLGHSDMQGATLTGGDFTDADLSYADLSGAHLYGAVLSGASLLGADLTGAVFEPEQIWDIDFTGARNMSQIIWGNELAVSPYIINQELDGRLEDAVIRYRDLKNLYKLHFHEEVIEEFHYRENVVKTKLSPEPLKILRKVFLDWTYGYGSRPLRLIPFCVGVILVFGFIYIIQTVLPGRSGIYLVRKGDQGGKTFHVRESGDPGQERKSYIMEELETGERKPSLLKFERGAVIVNCIYFSLLSFATFGYGALRPRQWLEFFRLTPVQYKPVGWSRIFVGFEAAIGIYLLALTAIVIFK
jgi:uncharacterized protein YjbI with pentapeptide repeats